MSSSTFTAILGMLGLLYRLMLREPIIKAIDDPDSEIDDLVVNLLDQIFGYKEE